MGVSINGGTQKMMFMFFDILKKWMRTGGTTILENLHIYIYILLRCLARKDVLINLVQLVEKTPPISGKNMVQL